MNDDHFEENLRLVVAFVRKMSVSGIVADQIMAGTGNIEVGRTCSREEWRRVERAAKELFVELREQGRIR